MLPDVGKQAVIVQEQTLKTFATEVTENAEKALLTYK